MTKIFTLLLSLLTITAFSQTTIYTENAGTPAATTLVNAYTGWQATDITYESLTTLTPDVRTSAASTGYAGASGSGNVFFNTGERNLLISDINTVGYSSITISFGALSSVIGSDLTVEYSTDGANYLPVVFPASTATTWALVTSTTSLPATANLRLRFSKNTTNQNRLDDIKLTGIGSTPNISAAPSALAGFSTTTGTSSTSQSFVLSATLLSPAAGNVTVTPSAGVEISLNNSTFVATPLQVAYTAGALAGTTIYVRLAATVTQGAFSGTVTNSGGTAPNAVVTVAGTVVQNFYNTKANLGLTNVGTWSSTLNGAGASPANFTDAYQTFNIVNQTNAVYTGVWNVSNAGNTVKVVVGDGTAPITFTIAPGADSLTSATRVDVLNASTLVIRNSRRPFFNNLATGSTVDFAQSGVSAADTVRIPAISYFNLTLTEGLKYFSGNTTTVRGNLVTNAVTSMNGSAPTFSTLNVFGDVTFNNSNFEPFPSGDLSRITLAMNGTGTQTITANRGVDPTGVVALFRLRRDSTTTNSEIVFGPGTNVSVGNLSGGGLQLNQGAATTTVLNLGNNNLAIVGGGAITASSLGKINAAGGSIGIAKTSGGSNAGILRFTTGSALAQLGINCIGFSRDSVLIADNITVGLLLTLTKGKFVTTNGSIITLPITAAIAGGSDSSFVDGKLRQTGAATINFPIGKGTKYAPVSVEVTAGGPNTYTGQYFNNSYGSFTIDPATLATYPNYKVSGYEYWTVDRANAGTANLVFNYTDANSVIAVPSGLRIAHFDGTDWNDLGGTPAPTNNATSGSVRVNGVTTFSPFTFSAITTGVIPIKLEYIQGRLLTSGVNALNWKVTCLSTNITMELQRSADSRQFTSLTSIAATQERCSMPFDYSDSRPLPSTNFYRLKMIDIDGRISYSPVVAISNAKKGFEIAGLYPNIVKTDALLSVTSPKSASLTTVISDMSGKIISTNKQTITEGSNVVRMDVSTLAAGTYTLTGIIDNTVKTIRFVKL